MMQPDTCELRENKGTAAWIAKKAGDVLKTRDGKKWRTLGYARHWLMLPAIQFINFALHALAAA